MSIGDTPVNTALSRAIRRGMKRRKIKANELAKLVGVKPPTVTGWVKGTHGARPRHIAKLAHVLQMPGGDFL